MTTLTTMTIFAFYYRSEQADIPPVGRTIGRIVQLPIEVKLAVVMVGVDSRFPSRTKTQQLTDIL